MDSDDEENDADRIREKHLGDGRQKRNKMKKKKRKKENEKKKKIFKKKKRATRSFDHGDNFSVVFRFRCSSDSLWVSSFSSNPNPVKPSKTQ